MTLLPHLAARLFGVPLAIHRPKLDVILSVLGPGLALPIWPPPQATHRPNVTAAPHPDRRPV